MLQDTISQIEGRLQSSATLSDSARSELLQLLAQLKAEIRQLPSTHSEQAQSIASFADVSTREAMRTTKNPELLKHSIGGLESSVGEFQTTHPQLVTVVNRIANMLSNMGI